MRSKRAQRREVSPDSKYKSVLLSRFIGQVMKDGKKSVAQTQVYKALEIASKQLKKEPMEVFEAAVRIISPQMEVRSRRVGGAAYQVPMPVRPSRASSLAMRWLVLEANKRPSKDYHSFAEKLAAEMTDALNEAGGSIEKRNTSHRMAEANKAFSHFRW